MPQMYTPAERAWLSQFDQSTRPAWVFRLRTEPDMTADVALVAAIQREIDAAYERGRKEARKE